MVKRTIRAATLTLALGFALAPAPSAAIAPALLLLFKQMAQQAATSMLKDTVLASLSGMGCKGMAMSNAMAAFDLRSAAGGIGGVTGGLAGGMPKIPAGMPPMPAGMGLPDMSNMPNMPNMQLGGLPTGTNLPPEIAARMAAMMPSASALPPGAGLDPAMFARLQQMLGQPLSPSETLATIDDLFELGFLPKAMQGELKECMVLVPSATAALGMGMGMLKPMIPQLRQAREQLRALPPAEHDEVAATLVQQIKPLPADQRASFLEYLDGGFFPARVTHAVKAGLAAR